MPNNNELQEAARKNRIIILSAIFLSLLITLFFIKLWTSEPVGNRYEGEIKKLMEDQNKAIADRNKYLEEKANIDRQRLVEQRTSDSIQLAEIRSSRSIVIKKINEKQNERINQIKRFTNTQLASAISSLPKSIR